MMTTNRSMLTAAHESELRHNLLKLRDAATRVWDTYRAYGPVDDGRPEGDAFAAALDALMEAEVAAGGKSKNKRKAKRAK